MDWTRTPGEAGAVVLPRTTEEVSRVLKICSQRRVPVVPSGGRTGLAGGATANGELALSLEKMNRIGPVDNAGRTVRVQAGAVTAAVHEATTRHGLTWPIDLAAKGSCQVGGNLSTNAGGVRVIRYGMSRKWVIGIQAVTMKGDILELNGDLEKNNTGYDLVQLIVGSEGTLAVITEATLRLTRLPKDSGVFLFPLREMADLPKLFEQVTRGPFETLAFEFFSGACLRSVQSKLGRTSRIGDNAPFYALLEAELPTAAAKHACQTWLEDLLGSGVVSDGWAAGSTEEAKEIWGFREGITESLQLSSPIVKKYDVSVAVRKIVPFLTEVEARVAEEGWKIDLFLFGHFGDGSPHLNLLKPPNVSEKQFLSDWAKFEGALFAMLKEQGGSVSAEHGVGCLKKNWLLYSRQPAELELLRGIKNAFDPDGLLNPGKVIG